MSNTDENPVFLDILNQHYSWDKMTGITTSQNNGTSKTENNWDAFISGSWEGNWHHLLFWIEKNGVGKERILSEIAFKCNWKSKRQNSWSNV